MPSNLQRWMLLLATAALPVAVPAADYSRDIQPVLKARCYSCHGALQQKAGLRLDTGGSVRLGGKEGPIVLPSNPDSSRLLHRISSTDPAERMPPEGEPLSREQISRIGEWIAAGAPSPADERPEPDPRDHWSFRPVRKPPIPAVANPPANPIDAFVQESLAKQGLVSAGPTSRAQLLRRVHLDLIGLPPTRAELAAFLDDTSPDAYEKVVDRLLNSPQHGERWARHWMDVWRYSDWYGRRHVPDVWNSAPQVWRWRQWIVESLNEDAGYDRMVSEMLAADEISPGDDRRRAATGFLVRNWYALNRNQWMRDIVEHTGKAFLGLTYNCAHCHDHKYDPISHQDYFRFRAFFEPIQVRQDWVPGEADPGPFQKYEYSANRRVVTNGVVSVFDETPEARTLVYLRGDERTFPDGKPAVGPGLSSFLAPGSTFEPNSGIPLPRQASYPGLKDFVREGEIAKRTRALETAKTNLLTADRDLATARREAAATGTNIQARGRALTALLQSEVQTRHRSNQLAVALADLDVLRKRIAADDARYNPQSRPAKNKKKRGTSPNTTSPAEIAVQAERSLALLRAQTDLAEAEGLLALLQAEHSIASSRRTAEGGSEKKEDREKADAAVKRATEKLTARQKSLEAIRDSHRTNQLAHTPLSPVYPETTSGRRKALAGWIASRENPLTARVAVNHIWARHFHAPLASPVYDFGRNGSPPTHPGLLDWLAAEFMEKGWSMKHLHRLIVTSQTYRKSSSTTTIPASHAQDPENRQLWRMNSGQMEAEVLRDSLLFAAGELDPSPVAYPLPNLTAETSRHRSLYFECFPEPNGQSDFAELFDAPNPLECYRRSQTIVPQQALALANSRLSDAHSRSLAGKLASEFPPATDPAKFVRQAWRQILSRDPSPSELDASLDFLSRSTTAGSSQNAAAGLVHALFNHHDFITIR